VNIPTAIRVQNLCQEVSDLVDEIAKEVAAEGNSGQWSLTGTPKTAELRRRSMDLTRALADLRRSN
jgi:hypothetical protein